MVWPTDAMAIVTGLALRNDLREVLGQRLEDLSLGEGSILDDVQVAALYPEVKR
jgi:hypothetical protein